MGAVLFLLGYLIFRRFFRYTDYGVILMECGVASMLFGFLYGSVLWRTCCRPSGSRS